MKKLEIEFYQRNNVCQLAKEFLGKIIISNLGGIETSGRIIEVEAYNGTADQISHAANGKVTKRNKIMYEEGGVCYVYLCYGINHLFNAITNEKGIPDAILFRSILPISGIHEMSKRLNKSNTFNKPIVGPGNVSKALAISTLNTGMSLLTESLYIADDGFKFNSKFISTSPRIGVKGNDSLLH